MKACHARQHAFGQQRSTTTRTAGYPPQTTPLQIVREFFGTSNPFTAFGGAGSGGDSDGDEGMGGMGGMPGVFRMFTTGGGGAGMPGGMAFSMGGGMPGMAAGMGGGMPGMRGGRGPTAAAGPTKAPPVKRQLLLTLEELYNGTIKRVRITRQRLNPDGKTSRSDEKVLELAIKAGWKKGTTLTFENEGDEAPGVIPADIQFIVGEKPHERFQRDGNDLIYHAKLSLADALAGTRLEIATLDGRKLSVPVTEVVAPGATKTLRGEGMPISKSPGSRGDLVIKFEVAFPAHLSEEKKRAIRSLLA